MDCTIGTSYNSVSKDQIWTPKWYTYFFAWGDLIVLVLLAFFSYIKSKDLETNNYLMHLTCSQGLLSIIESIFSKTIKYSSTLKLR